jgi:predicted TIM-barrel fold metal-dependent hydrolase
VSERPGGSAGSAVQIALVDHHVHGVVPGELDRSAFELLISESGRPAPSSTSHFQSPIGLAIRRACAPVLGLEPLAPPEAYLEARAALGPAANERLLAASKLAGLLVDTGHRSREILGPREMGELAGAPAREVARLERLAELVAERSSGPSEYLRLLPHEIEAAAKEVVGWKTIVAYRYGFDLETRKPERRELTAALDAWFEPERGPGRLDSPVVLRHLLGTLVEASAATRLPLQVHAGFGDADLDLHRADPVVFTPWVRLFGEAGMPVVFLHCYPYHRQAGYLAEVFPHVYFDVGCILNYAGPGSRRVLEEALELAPFTKMLYSSDAFGLAELVYLGAEVFRRQLSAVLVGWVAAGECTGEDAEEIARLIGEENARRLYRLDEAAAGRL